MVIIPSVNETRSMVASCHRRYLGVFIDGVDTIAIIASNRKMSKITKNFRRLSSQLSGIPSFILAAANAQTTPNVPGQVPLGNLAQSMFLRARSSVSGQTLDQIAFRSQKRQLTYQPSEEGASSQGEEDETIRMKKANEAINERTVQFLSITYGILLIITGAMCTFFNINQPKNHLRDLFMIIISIVGFMLVGFFHYDINRYRRWALKIIKPMMEEERHRLGRRKSRISLDHNPIDGDPQDHSYSSNNDEDEEDDEDDLPPYDTVSMNTAAIFDFIDQNNDPPSPPVSLAPPSINFNSNNEQQQQATVSFIFDNNTSQSPQSTPFTQSTEQIRIEAKLSVNSYIGRQTLSTSKGVAYRYFRGKHANDFYLKIGMIVFCFGSILHIGIDIVKQSYYFIHQDLYCRNGTLILMESVQFVFSFYQLYVIFRYSNIIINRYKNLARFALMHLMGTAISCWLDTIVDEAINDYVELKLSVNNTDETNPINLIHHCNGTMNMDSHGLNNHINYVANCSKTSILSNDSLKAFPYLYPFTIEFNIILASIWYMVWSNIGKVKDESLFTESYQTRLMHKYRLANTLSNADDHHDIADNHSDISRRSSLQLTMDCHASNKGLFFGLAILLIILITIIIFFSTIHKSVSFHFGVITYTMQLLLLTFSCFFCIPFAYKRMRCLDVVAPQHRNNAFMMMEDILILIPIPFYFVHYVISAVASLLIGQQLDFNDLMLIGIDILTILQVLIQSPFIVDNLRRCCNDPEMRRKKPGRQLVTLILILNVTLWILNTLELKSVEVFHASHRYFGEFFSMILSHTTLPMMLFYRFHSSVCLSNIWKYAYEKDE